MKMETVYYHENVHLHVLKCIIEPIPTILLASRSCRISARGIQLHLFSSTSDTCAISLPDKDKPHYRKRLEDLIQRNEKSNAILKSKIKECTLFFLRFYKL